MKRMTRRTFLPAINKYATLVANEINEMKAACAGIDTSVQDQLLNTVVDGIKEINDALNELHAAHLAIRDLTDEQEKANKYAHEIVPMMERLRAGVTLWRSWSLTTCGPSSRTTTSCSTASKMGFNRNVMKRPRAASFFSSPYS